MNGKLIVCLLITIGYCQFALLADNEKGGIDLELAIDKDQSGWSKAATRVAIVTGALLLAYGLCTLRKRRVEHQKKALETEVELKTLQYTQANAELKKLNEISSVLSEVSTKFINLPASQIDEEIPIALGRIAAVTGAQRASISFFEDDQKFVNLRYQWSSPGVDNVPEMIHRFDMSAYPWIYERILKGVSTVVTNPETDLPAEATNERQMFEAMDWQSAAIIPLRVEGAAIGHVGLTTIERTHDWPANVVEDLSIAGQVFANAFDRRDRIAALMALRRDALDAEEQERTRIARELHDQLGGTLSGLRIHSRALEKQLEQNPELAENARRITGIIDMAMPEVHRICAELRPAILDNLDIHSAVEELTIEFTKDTGVPCRFDLQYTDSISSDRVRDVALYRITSELLTNVARHSGATKAEVSIGRNIQKSEIILTVKDNGCGIDFEELKKKNQHFGLRGAAERAELLEGTVSIKNGTAGAIIEVTVPETRSANSI